MPVRFIIQRFRWLVLAGALLTLAAPVAAQGIATPVSAAGVGPRRSAHYTPTAHRFAETRSSATTTTAARRDVVLRLSTLAVVLGVVILVLLLV